MMGAVIGLGHPARRRPQRSEHRLNPRHDEKYLSFGLDGAHSVDHRPGRPRRGQVHRTVEDNSATELRRRCTA